MRTILLTKLFLGTTSDENSFEKHNNLQILSLLMTKRTHHHQQQNRTHHCPSFPMILKSLKPKERKLCPRLLFQLLHHVVAVQMQMAVLRTSPYWISYVVCWIWLHPQRGLPKEIVSTKKRWRCRWWTTINRWWWRSLQHMEIKTTTTKVTAKHKTIKTNKD